MFDNKEMDALEIRKKLKLLDELCKKENINADFLVVGGAALNLILHKNNLESRGTMDIDVEISLTNKEEALNGLLELLDIGKVGGLLLPDILEIKETNEYEELDDDYSNIKVYFVTVEMFICIKSLTKRPRDRDDILNKDILSICDPKKTISLINEYLPYHLNPEDPELNVNDVLPILEEML